MRRSPDDFREEIEAHLELEADELRRTGMDATEAAFAARRQFGNVTQVQEQRYESTHRRWLHELREDARYGARVLRRSPVVSAIAVIVLAIGIGAPTALYSAIENVVLRPLPFANPDRLAVVAVVGARQSSIRSGASVPDFIDWRARTATFAGLGAYRPWGYEIETDAEPERVTGARVTANLFSLLGVASAYGRVFRSDEDEAGREHVVVLSDTLWRRRYHGDRNMLGNSIQLNGTSYTVIGIVPAGAMLPDAALWVPFVFAPYEREQRGDRSLSVIGRLASGASVAAAQSDMRSIMRDLALEYPDADGGWEMRVVPLQQDLIGNARRSLYLLLGATLSLLFVAWANLSNVMLARGVARRREMALRSALGASRARIIRQHITESMLLVGLAGAISLLVAIAATRWLAALGPEYLPRSAAVKVDARAVAFALALTAVVGIGLAVLTSYLVSSADLSSPTRETPSGLRPTGRIHVRDVFVVAQLAIALVLLIDGALLVSSFRRIQAVKLGFEPQHVISATVSLPAGRYARYQQRIAFFEDVVRRLSALPGVSAAAVASRLPLSSGAAVAVMNTISVDGATIGRNAALPRALTVVVSPGYFDATGLPLVAGRAFNARDRDDAPRAIIVDETLARQLAADGNVVGKRVHMTGGTGADTSLIEIVGVVGAVHVTSVANDPDPVVYLPHAQTAWPTMSLVVKAASDPRAIVASMRTEVAAVDPSRPVYAPRLLDETVAQSLAPRRFQMALLAGFALGAVALALLGVYGILSFAVAGRARELGIRMALGASSAQVRELVLRNALTRIAIGVVGGVALASACGSVLQSLLFQLSAWDWRVFAGAIGSLSAAGLAASYVPAQRAARADPLIALRRD